MTGCEVAVDSTLTGVGEEAAGVEDNEAGPFTGGATYFWRLIPVPEALVPTPDYDQTAIAVVQAVVSTVQPKDHASLHSPDKNWRVEIIIYDCVNLSLEFKVP